MQSRDQTPASGAVESANDVPPAPAGSFTLVVLPDTQDYIPEAPEVFEAEIAWVLDHRQSQNICFVSHVGDVVNDCRDPSQWAAARDLMMRFHGRVAYGICPGNRDMLPDGDSTALQATFPESMFRSMPWYGGGYKNNADSYQLISVEGIDLLILHLECNAPDDVLAWAGDVLDRHADRAAIVVAHMYLGPIERPTSEEGWFSDPKGRMRWIRRHEERGNTPEQIWEKCLSRHANVVLVCCGDQSRTQTMRQVSRGVHGNRVHECLSDYREGYLRLYRFHPADDSLEVFTYSPYLGRLCEGTDLAPERDAHQFVLSVSLRR